MLVEVVILLGGLAAGVGQVEHVLGLLRVEHQRVLVGLFQREQHLCDQLLGALLPDCGAPRQVVVILLQLGVQEGERHLQILLLQHGAGRSGDPHEEDDQ